MYVGSIREKKIEDEKIQKIVFNNEIETGNF